MSAEGDVISQVPVAEVDAAAVQGSRAITMEDALREVLRRSLHHDGLARGLREAVKSLDVRSAKLCVLAESCEEKEYVRLIKALCAEHAIQLIEVADAKQLGEWVGLCKIDKNGDAQKVVSCACAVVRDFGEQSEYLDVLLDQVKSR